VLIVSPSRLFLASLTRQQRVDHEAFCPRGRFFGPCFVLLCTSTLTSAGTDRYAGFGGEPKEATVLLPVLHTSSYDGEGSPPAGVITRKAHDAAESARRTRNAVLLHAAAVRAVQAPSVHNTQPWQFTLTDTGLLVHADYRRQLTVLDPRARQLAISCGAALFTLRVALAASGFDAKVERYGGLGASQPLARVSVAAERPGHRLARLEPAIDVRRTNRRAYVPGTLPRDLVDDLVASANAEDAELIVLDGARQRIVAELGEQAERIEQADPAYVAELRRWTTDDPRRNDGVQEASVPYAGELDSTDERTLALLCTRRDDRHSWLRAGEALQHVWLELTRQGYWASPLAQVVEVRSTREELRYRLGLSTFPQLLLRIGQAPEVPYTRRREFSEVIADETTVLFTDGI
jgi:nitroreductase